MSSSLTHPFRPDLQSKLEALYGLERRRDKLGLEGTRALLEALGNPHARFRAVHVAGTNGKGSTCAMIERVLRAAGHHTGLFTSPHLVDFRERIRVDGRWADADTLEALLDRIAALPAAETPTFFEVCTALGFETFAAQHVAWAVVEVGLGGRLDTTNVLTPEVCVVTAIGLDHVEILGGTIEAVAEEKAGIVKPGVPVVCAAGTPAAEAVIARVAQARGAPLVRAAGRVAVHAVADLPAGQRLALDAPPWGALDVMLPLPGRHQVANARAALAALGVLAERGLALSADAVCEGLARVRWPGRLERSPEEPRLWWDGAHNAAGIETLVRVWHHDLGFAPPAAVVLALSRDKDARAIAAALGRLAPGATVVATRSRNERAMDPETLATALRASGFEVETTPTLVDGVRRALVRASAGRVLLTGSLFAVGEAMASFGGAPGADQ